MRASIIIPKGNCHLSFFRNIRFEKILHFEVKVNWRLELLYGDCAKQKRLKKCIASISETV
jgi:hypothetical protein